MQGQAARCRAGRCGRTRSTPAASSPKPTTSRPCVSAGAPVSGSVVPVPATVDGEVVVVVGMLLEASTPRMPLSLQIAGSPQAEVPGERCGLVAPGTVPSEPEPLLLDEPPAPVPGPWLPLV